MSRGFVENSKQPPQHFPGKVEYEIRTTLCGQSDGMLKKPTGNRTVLSSTVLVVENKPKYGGTSPHTISMISVSTPHAGRPDYV